MLYLFVSSKASVYVVGNIVGGFYTVCVRERLLLCSIQHFKKFDLVLRSADIASIENSIQSVGLAILKSK